LIVYLSTIQSSGSRDKNLKKHCYLIINIGSSDREKQNVNHTKIERNFKPIIHIYTVTLRRLSAVEKNPQQQRETKINFLLTCPVLVAHGNSRANFPHLINKIEENETLVTDHAKWS
jgi:hypothetical protein